MMVKTFSKLGLYISNDKDLKGLNRSKLSQKKKKKYHVSVTSKCRVRVGQKVPNNTREQ